MGRWAAGTGAAPTSRISCPAPVYDCSSARTACASSSTAFTWFHTAVSASVGCASAGQRPGERNPEGSEQGPRQREPERGASTPSRGSPANPQPFLAGFSPWSVSLPELEPSCGGGGGQVGVNPGCPATVVLLTGVPEQPPAPGWPRGPVICSGGEARSNSPQPWVCPSGRDPPLPGETPGWQRWGEDFWDGRDAMGDGHENSRWRGCGTQDKDETKKGNKNPISLSKSRKKLGPWSSSL